MTSWLVLFKYHPSIGSSSRHVVPDMFLHPGPVDAVLPCLSSQTGLGIYLETPNLCARRSPGHEAVASHHAPSACMLELGESTSWCTKNLLCIVLKRVEWERRNSRWIVRHLHLDRQPQSLLPPLPLQPTCTHKCLHQALRRLWSRELSISDHDTGGF